jgi:hypothetical protein
MVEKAKENLTKEESEAIERAEQFIRERAKIPVNSRHPITNPDKYNFPIGMDDKGNLNTANDEDEARG